MKEFALIVSILVHPVAGCDRLVRLCGSKPSSYNTFLVVLINNNSLTLMVNIFAL